MVIKMSNIKQLQCTQAMQILEQTYDSIITTSLDGTILTWNHGSEELFGYSANEMITQHITILSKSKNENNFKTLLQVLYKQGRIKHETQILTKSQKLLDISLSLSLLKDKNGEVIGIVGYAHDISKSKEAERKLAEKTYNFEQYLDVIDKIGIGLFVVDDDFRVRYMNKSLIKWFGNQTGKMCYSSIAKLDNPCPYCKLHEVIAENKKVVYNPETPDGQSFEIVATSIKNSDGTVSKMEVIRNVTEQKKAQENLDYLSHHDTLTKLPNRVLFQDRLTQAMEKAKRDSLKVGLLFIDLDHFKEINDSLGHNIGDEVLKIVTQRLTKVINDGDTLSRLGGDEFSIVLKNLKHIQDASFVAKQILDILTQEIIIQEHKLYMTSSIGISVYPDDSEDMQNLLKYADSAMFKAKDEGRNNFQFYTSEMTELAFERVVMEASLREALVKEEFVVYYQPQVDAKANKLVGMEALVRWKHPTMGLVSPARFIPLAETTGLIVELDDFVMKTAMAQLALWYKQGYKPGKLALNLAVKQLQQNNFIEKFEKFRKESGCDAKNLELEVTESQIMNNPREAIVILQKIRNLGIELAVDDFGTGYSSLAYLKRLPINKLKIDQAFVRNLPNDEEDSAIARAVIALANSLSLKIIAEGVETKEQKEFIVENGCDNIQGYFYSKPIPAKEFEEKFLKSGLL